jgi:hypothetical protein
MAFNVTPTPTSVTLPAGGSADVTYTFSDVPAELVEQVSEIWALGPVTVNVNIGAVLDEPDPQRGVPTLPAGITAQLLSLSRSEAVIRYTRV